MKTLLEPPGRMKFHTHLGPIFDAIGDRLAACRWLVTDWECSPYVEPLGYRPIGTPRLITGADLPRLAEESDPQFIWAVLSGFAPSALIDLDRLAVVPWADGNRAVWDPTGRPQYPDAIVEIVCFDSTSTIVTSDDEDLHRRLSIRRRRGHAPSAARARPNTPTAS